MTTPAAAAPLPPQGGNADGPAEPDPWRPLEGAGFAPAPFKAADALLQIKRSLRDLKLAERGNGFELRGKRVVELGIEGDAIQSRLARTQALTPQWDAMAVRSAPEQRKLLDEIKKRLARWAQDE